MCTSLLPLDVGFDVRATHRLIRITCDGRRYRYLDETDSPQTIVAHWRDVAHVGETLARCGYSVVVAQTATGREIQCTPVAQAPAGHTQREPWSTIAWAVRADRDGQPAVIRPTLGRALAAAGIPINSLLSLAIDIDHGPLELGDFE